MRRFVIAASIVPLSLVAMAAAGIAEPTRPIGGADPERRICRTMEVTGKLAARRRTCLTRAEWDRVAEEQRKTGQAWITAVDSCARRGEGGPCGGN